MNNPVQKIESEIKNIMNMLSGSWFQPFFVVENEHFFEMTKLC